MSGSVTNTVVTTSRAPDRNEVSAGWVSLNVVPDEEAMIERHKATGATGGDTFVYPETLANGLGNIAIGEILFGARNAPVKKQLGGGATARYAPSVVSSFNGMDTGIKKEFIDEMDKPGMTQAEKVAADEVLREWLFRQLWPVGLTREYYTFKLAHQTKAGLAAGVRVSMSYVNSGTKPLRAGDLISVNVPPLASSLRQEYLAARDRTNAAANGLPANKLVLVTEAFNAPNAAWTVFKAALMRSVVDGTINKKENAALLDLVNLSKPGMDDKTRTEYISAIVTGNRATYGTEIGKLEQIVKTMASIFSAAQAHVVGRADSDCPPGRKGQGTFFF